MKPTSINLSYGAGGQALGVENAGFDHLAVIAPDPFCGMTMQANRPHWPVYCGAVEDFDFTHVRGHVDLFSMVLSLPFDVPRDNSRIGVSALVAAMELIAKIQPRAIMLDISPSFFDNIHHTRRAALFENIERLGYRVATRSVMPAHFGVALAGRRVIAVAFREKAGQSFSWPLEIIAPVPSVGKVLFDMMSACGWRAAERWRDEEAVGLAPPIYIGSRHRGAPTLGPKRSRMKWAKLGINGVGLASRAPDPDFVGRPKLTEGMVARLQGYPDNWEIVGHGAARLQQLSNAAPPAVIHAIAERIGWALLNADFARVIAAVDEIPFVVSR